MFELLYYPLIHPPKQTLLEATLYWDSLTSLVPELARRDSYILQDDLRRLEDEGFYRRTELEPLMFEQDDAINRVMKTITRVINRADPQTLVIPDRLSADTRLWSGKLPWVVEERLRSHRLLVDDDRQDGALRGNPKVLLATIACFAEEASMLLEGQAGDRVVPSTDNRYAHACATIPLAKSNAQVSWMVDVGQLLPIPDHDTPITEVLQFRRRHGDELARCMEASRKLLAELRQEIDNPREVVMAFEGQIAEAITDLRNAAKSRLRWAVKRTSWFAVATGATAVAGSASAEGFNNALPLVLAASTVAGGIAVNIASASTRQRDERFSYLHQLSVTFPST